MILLSFVLHSVTRSQCAFQWSAVLLMHKSRQQARQQALPMGQRPPAATGTRWRSEALVALMPLEHFLLASTLLSSLAGFV
jgi:hypothetical protein